MRRIMMFIVVIVLAAGAPSAYKRWQAHARENPPALEVVSNGAVQSLDDGLYAYKGIDTQHGPQCVEYAERFYTTLYPKTFPYHNSGPGAYDIWEGIAEQKDVGGWASHRQYFVAYENGTTVPQADDMLLYDRTRGSGWGHIAIIAEVHPDAVVILEQNSGHDTRKVLPLVENRIVDRGVQGVIRLKQNDH
ncbi:CHAP domain-containing protein [Tumebacillus permanentifrigoris]|uniref:CHAP domain-containing protein n=1 Tax=Tumebacillus permanentifrigoris TaxID=378543 RepID=A0A316D9N4_9BACL|nr:CHAP domain-containing protein [Tumebacillus permanentifrigoris]PWK13353.1 CHAP domain-containing protein [Tumebacillus permanentifrigoris]